MQSLAVLPIGFDQSRDHEHEGDVLANNGGDSGSNDLDDHFLAIMKLGGVHLGDGGGGEWCFVEPCKSVLDFAPQGLLNTLASQGAVERRDLVLQILELIGHIIG